MYIKTPSNVLPVSLEEAKLWLKIESDETIEDTLITRAIKTAAGNIESHCNIALNTTTIVEHWDCWQRGFKLQRGPVQAVSSVKYLSGGTYTELPSTAYTIDKYSDVARLMILNDVSLPIADSAINAIEIEYTAGFGDAATDIPPQVIDALLMQITGRYVHRDDKISMYTDKYVTASMSLLRDFKSEYSR